MKPIFQAVATVATAFLLIYSVPLGLYLAAISPPPKFMSNDTTPHEQDAKQSTTGALALRGDFPKTFLDPAAKLKRDELVAAAEAITEVSSPEGAEAARKVKASLTTFRTSVESSRKIIKAPVLELGKAIDKFAADVSAPVEKEESRVNGLILGYARAEAEAAQKRQQEAAALRAEEERKARLAEEDRLKAEKATREANVTTATAPARPTLAQIAQQARQAEDAELLRQQAAASAQQAASASTVAAQATVAAAQASRPAVSLSQVLDYEVTDIKALYMAFPGLVKMEDRRSDILATLKVLEADGRPAELPGLRVFKKDRVN